ENQRLRDEINRLKGEQGRPKVQSNTPQPPHTDHSSEQERRKPKTWSKRHKTDCIPIDREQVVEVAPDRLPPGAVFKGYEDVVVQDVIFRTDNVLFHKEKFYSTVVFCRFWCHCDTLRPSPILWVKGQTSHAASHRSSRSPRDRPRGHLSRSL